MRLHTGVALFPVSAAPGQLRLFWIAPLMGAAVGALIWRFLLSSGDAADSFKGTGFVDVTVTHLEMRG